LGISQNDDFGAQVVRNIYQLLEEIVTQELAKRTTRRRIDKFYSSPNIIMVVKSRMR
jgi:hypothetical protein